MRKNYLLFGILFLSSLAGAQDTTFFFQQTAGPGFCINSDTSFTAFTGGFHKPRFSNVDLNRDGVQDIVVMDNEDYHVMTFLGNGDKSNPHFDYAPEYEVFFPRLFSWLIVRDFNGDGKGDLFTANNIGGVMVYKNVSANGKLAFKLYNDDLEHFDSDLNIFTPMFVSPADVPAIEDIDFDGDIDIMSFDPTGGNVTFYKNMTQEEYNHKDSFNFKVSTYCWGRFQENDSTNDLVFNTSCFLFKKGRHAGSNLLALDIDADNDMDLMLSDVSYSTAVVAVNAKSDNGHNRDTIHKAIVKYPPTDPMDVDLFPSLHYLDINFDKVNDLVAAPSSQEENFIVQNTWAYTNAGANNNPDFKLQQKDFIQGETIEFGEYTYPAFFDYDGDGDQDLFVASPTPYTNFEYEKAYYRLAQLENVGSAKRPVYKLINEDYLSLTARKLPYFAPAFGDIDNDGTVDLLLGTEKGRVILYSNANGPDKAASFSFASSFFKEAKVSGMAQACVVDISGDGKNDLILGDVNGTISYFQWKTDTLELITDNWGGIEVGYSGVGFASPFVADVDDDGKLELLVGDNLGYLYYYDDIDLTASTFKADHSIVLNQVTKTADQKDFGAFVSITGADVNDDGLVDLVLGSKRGGVSYLAGHLEVINGVYQPSVKSNVQVFPNPSTGHFTVSLGSENKRALVRVVNINGQVVQEQNINDQQTINASTLQGGTYLVMVYSEDGQISTHKLLIKP